MKAAGIIIIITSFSVFGFYISQKQLSVLKGIKRAERFLKSVLICLNSEHMPIKEILEYIAKISDDETKRFVLCLEDYDLINSLKTADICDFCPSNEAVDIISEAFSILGKYSVDEQNIELENCIEKLKNVYSNTEETTKNKAAFSKISGILCGFLAAVLLI